LNKKLLVLTILTLTIDQVCTHLNLPIGLGLEGAGIITEIGENVKDFKVGDKISYAGIPLGSYSTHRNYPTKNLVKVPEGIDLEVAATLMTKGLTTFYLLHKTFPVKSGQTILFHAAAGGVGQIFGQWAKSLGLHSYRNCWIR
jgi:NADPH2:quinone reductase